MGIRIMLVVRTGVSTVLLLVQVMDTSNDNTSGTSTGSVILVVLLASASN